MRRRRARSSARVSGRFGAGAAGSSAGVAAAEDAAAAGSAAGVAVGCAGGDGSAERRLAGGGAVEACGGADVWAAGLVARDSGDWRGDSAGSGNGLAGGGGGALAAEAAGGGGGAGGAAVRGAPAEAGGGGGGGVAGEGVAGDWTAASVGCRQCGQATHSSSHAASTCEAWPQFAQRIGIMPMTFTLTGAAACL
jgi:hypothetical protein